MFTYKAYLYLNPTMLINFWIRNFIPRALIVLYEATHTYAKEEMYFRNYPKGYNYDYYFRHYKKPPHYGKPCCGYLLWKE